MKLQFRIKPYAEIEGKGTTKQAIYHLWNGYDIGAVPNCYSTFGDYYKRLNDKENAWLYTMEVFKRGKYRKNKHYKIKIYKVPLAILKYFKVKVYQGRGSIKVKYD